MVRLSLALGLMIGAAIPAFAQDPRIPQQVGGSHARGTPDDQKACERDAVKYCRRVLGDDMAVLSCFQQNRRKLHPACDAVLRKYGQ
jgi:hypothetical protein